MWALPSVFHEGSCFINWTLAFQPPVCSNKRSGCTGRAGTGCWSGSKAQLNWNLQAHPHGQIRNHSWDTSASISCISNKIINHLCFLDRQQCSLNYRTRFLTFFLLMKRELWALTHWPGSGSLKYLCGCSPVLLPRPWPPLQGPNKDSEWINSQRTVRLKKLFLFQKG